jgi:hypothetical protein
MLKQFAICKLQTFKSNLVGLLSAAAYLVCEIFRNDVVSNFSEDFRCDRPPSVVDSSARA